MFGAGWRKPSARQEFLAVPILGGFRQINLALPTMNGQNPPSANNLWHCQQ